MEHMAYQVYFADLTEENRGLVLAILKLKEEADTLEPGEAEVLYELRGSRTPAPIPPEENSPRQRNGNQGGGQSEGQGQGGGQGGGQRRGQSRRGGSRPRGGGGNPNTGGASSGGSTN
jgi:hypothetical protein